MGFMQRIANAFARFMEGRYARMDLINILLAVLYLILLIVNMFVSGPVLSAVMLVVLIIFLMRYLSHNVSGRVDANEKLLRLLKPLHLDRVGANVKFRLKRLFNRKNSRFNDPNYVYFLCPNCSRQLRVPKGRGKICVTCPMCGHQHIKIT